MRKLFPILWLYLLSVLGAQTVVTGRLVSDLGGKPVPGARVIVTSSASDPSAGISDGDGRFRLELTPGRYSFHTEHTGFFPVTDDVEIRRDVGDLGDFTLTEKRSISLTVRWADGEPAMNAVVTPMRVRNRRATWEIGNTDHPRPANARGEVTLTGLPPGRFVLQVGSLVSG